MVYRIEFLIEIYCVDKRGVNASITVYLVIKFSKNYFSIFIDHHCCTGDSVVTILTDAYIAKVA